MSREDAILNLRDMMGGIPFGKSFDEQFDACSVAIRSLEAWEKIKDEVYKIKHTLYAQNTDYQTGYLCALSVVEGLIAEHMEEVEE